MSPEFREPAPKSVTGPVTETFIADVPDYVSIPFAEKRAADQEAYDLAYSNAVKNVIGVDDIPGFVAKETLLSAGEPVPALERGNEGRFHNGIIPDVPAPADPSRVPGWTGDVRR